MSNAQKLKQLLDKELPRPAQGSDLLSTDTPTDNLFLDIDLDTEEEIEALRAARESKHYRLIREDYARRITQDIERPSFTAEDVFERFRSQYTVEPESAYEKIVKHLCAYFTGDPRFARDPMKGLLLCGNVGVGKTILMEFFQRNQKASYRIVECRDIEAAYGNPDPEFGGDKAIAQYGLNFKVPLNSNPFGHREYGYCFDDLGTEVIGKHYGKAKEVMLEVLSKRYDGRLDHYMTHVTTNLGSHEIKERYGERVFDRMREMFNIIEFPLDAKSRRK